MVKYNCERCGFETPHKTKFNKHLHRRYTCEPKLSNININILRTKFYSENPQTKRLPKKDQVSQNVSQMFASISQMFATNGQMFANNNSEKKHFNCDYCGKKFMHLSSKSKHMKSRCKVVLGKEKKDEKKSKLEKKLEEMEQTVKNLQKELAEKNRSNSIKNEVVDEKEQVIDNTIVANQNSNANIKVNPFGEIDYSHLTDEDYLKSIKKGNLGIPYILQQLYFNPKKKENYCAYISNIRKNYISLFDGKRWNYAIGDETIYMLIEDNLNVIEDKIIEWKDNNHPFVEKYKEILEKFPRFLDRYSDSKYVDRKVFEESKLLMFNNRDLVIEHKKKHSELYNGLDDDD